MELNIELDEINKILLGDQSIAVLECLMPPDLARDFLKSYIKRTHSGLKNNTPKAIPKLTDLCIELIAEKNEVVETLYAIYGPHSHLAIRKFSFGNICSNYYFYFYSLKRFCTFC